MRGAGDQLARTRLLNSRSIPWAFTDLVAAVFKCLPSGGRESGALALRAAVAAAEVAGADQWPEAAADLFRRCRTAAADDVPVLPAGILGPALTVDWAVVAGRLPAPRPGWATRCDIGDPEEDA